MAAAKGKSPHKASRSHPAVGGNATPPLVVTPPQNPHVNLNHPAGIPSGGVSHAGAAIAPRSHEGLSFRPTKATGITLVGPAIASVPGVTPSGVSLSVKRRRFP